ncbi:MAG: hypothetical protein OEY96_11630 [Gammaproteobacteria bacterium]|nr:hypothetical protein [Gammaproteobacteria bacterium]
MDFKKLFISEELPYKGRSRRDKFLSRVFGIFNEEIIRIWCKNERSSYVNLGRPTVYDVDGKNFTLDFLLKDKDGNLFLSEMKCEIEYQKYKYLVLEDPKQLEHHRKKRAFQIFIEMASNPNKHLVKCNSEEVHVSGAILIWGKVSDGGRKLVEENFKLSGVISTESVIKDLIEWKDESYLDFISEYNSWCNELFSSLKGDDKPNN